MSDGYRPGSIKRKPGSLTVAVRADESILAYAWWIFEPSAGGHGGTYDDVIDWTDID